MMKIRMKRAREKGLEQAKMMKTNQNQDTSYSEQILELKYLTQSKRIQAQINPVVMPDKKLSKRDQQAIHKKIFQEIPLMISLFQMIQLKKTLREQNRLVKVEVVESSILEPLKKRKILNLSFNQGEPLSKTRPKADPLTLIQVYQHLAVDNHLFLPAAREKVLNLIMKTRSKIKFKMR